MDGQPSEFFFEWLAEVRVWSLWLVSFLVGLRTYQHAGRGVIICEIIVHLLVIVPINKDTRYKY